MKLMKKLVCLTLAAVAVVTVAACDNTDYSSTLHTYNSYVSVSPSNWNELTYKDNNDTTVMGYIGSSFFSYDYKFDENGEVVPNDYEVVYSAATKLEDVSADYVGHDVFQVEEGSTGYAYKITLREDLKWQNGDPIKAEDFVYTMEQQLDPAFKNYRADSFYNGALELQNAKAYFMQGDKGWFAASTAYSTYSEDLDSKLYFSIGSLVAKDEEIYTKEDGTVIYGDGAKAKSYIRSWLESQLGTDEFNAAQAASILTSNFLKDLDPAKLAALEGKTLAEIKADAEMKAVWDAVIGWWQTEPNEELHFFAAEYTFPAVDFNTVGIFVGDTDYELIIVLAKPLHLLKEDGSLSYKAAYNLSSLPLVHRATYEECKREPVEGNTLWTSVYNSSVETTMSWGPYKLTEFQHDKQFVLERNTEWFAYSLPENEGLYQTDRIVYDIIKEWNTAWMAFQKGQIDEIGIDVTIAQDYKNSEQAIYTPDDYVGSLQLQSNVEALETRELEANDGMDRSLLAYPEFRKALSLSIDRADYNNKCTTASKTGLGLFTGIHYYDVENGGAYRYTDPARQVLCDVYGVDATKFDSLTQAEASITGYDLTQAKELVKSAVAKAIADGKYEAGKKIYIEFGSGAVNETVQRRFDYIKGAWETLFVGTPLEGKLEMGIKDYADKWADDFRDGAYDVCMGGWTGAAWDPGYFLLAYISPDYMFSKAWNTAEHMMTFTLEGAGEDGADVTKTLSILEWYDILNGQHEPTTDDVVYDWSEGAVETDKRLKLIAAIEGEVLKQYYTVPLNYSFGASLITYKWDFISRDYNTFMSYGGLKYITYNYTDGEWLKFVKKDNNGTLNYKD